MGRRLEKAPLGNAVLEMDGDADAGNGQAPTQSHHTYRRKVFWCWEGAANLIGPKELMKTEDNRVTALIETDSKIIFQKLR